NLELVGIVNDLGPLSAVGPPKNTIADLLPVSRINQEVERPVPGAKCLLEQRVVVGDDDYQWSRNGSQHLMQGVVLKILDQQPAQAATESVSTAHFNVV